MNQPKQPRGQAADWEQRLQQMRQTRTPAPQNSAPAATKKSDAAMRERLMRQYLAQWQAEHNAPLAETESVETDAMVILQENWLQAQNAVQLSASDRHIESSRQMWFNPKRQTLTPCEPEAVPSENAAAEREESDDLPDEEIRVRINVLNPQAVGRKEVFCVSEAELAERLVKRIRPHLMDAVNGMMRTALQKQMALLNYQLQQTLNEQAPGLVEDVLEHNVKKILSELKYEMKYKP